MGVPLEQRHTKKTTANHFFLKTNVKEPEQQLVQVRHPLLWTGRLKDFPAHRLLSTGNTIWGLLMEPQWSATCLIHPWKERAANGQISSFVGVKYCGLISAGAWGVGMEGGGSTWVLWRHHRNMQQMSQSGNKLPHPATSTGFVSLARGLETWKTE